MIGIIALISFFAIAITTCILALVICISNGLERATLTQLQGIHSDIIMESQGNSLDGRKIITLLEEHFPEIVGMSPYSSAYVILRNPHTHETTVVMLKAIDPALERNTTVLEKTITDGISDHNLTHLVSNNQILIGEKLAQNLALFVGESTDILFYTHEDTHSQKIIFDQIKAPIGGTFNTGIEEFDSAIVYCSFSLFNDLFPNKDITSIGLKIDPHYVHNKNIVLSRLKKTFSIDVYTWQELYPALIRALKLERYAMITLLSFMMLLASIIILSLLLVSIISKRADIAILLAMGMPLHQIKYIFMLMGLIIAFFGSSFGLATAYLIGWLINTYKLIPLPDVYYISYLPVQLSLTPFLTIILFVLILTFFITLIPVRYIRYTTLATTLRREK